MFSTNWNRRGWMRSAAAIVVGGMATVGGVFPASPALAQDEASAVAEGVGAQVVQRSLDQMRDTVMRTADLIGLASKRSIGVIGKLDEKGVADAVLVRAAHNGLEGVKNAADRGHEQVQGIVVRASRVLMKLGAPDPAFGALRAGAEKSHEAIAGHAQAARQAIVGALNEALGEVEEPAAAE